MKTGRAITEPYKRTVNQEKKCIETNGEMRTIYSHGLNKELSWKLPEGYLIQGLNPQSICHQIH